MASVSSGIRRKVDDLGRVVIPAGIRRSLNIREGDAVEVSVDGERIVLTKPRDACVFCGREGEDDLHRFRSRLVCSECVATIARTDAASRAEVAGMPAAATERPAPVERPTPTRGAAASAPGPASSGEDASPAWPTGPIDGDELARSAAGRSRPDPRSLGERPDAPPTTGPSSYDPASRTAW